MGVDDDAPLTMEGARKAALHFLEQETGRDADKHDKSTVKQVLDAVRMLEGDAVTRAGVHAAVCQVLDADGDETKYCCFCIPWGDEEDGASEPTPIMASASSAPAAAKAAAGAKAAMKEAPAVYTPTEKDEKMYRKAYRLFDKDGDGVITVEDILIIWRELGIKEDTEACEKMIREADVVYSDGKISFEEFVICMNKPDNVSGLKMLAVGMENLRHLRKHDQKIMRRDSKGKKKLEKKYNKLQKKHEKAVKLLREQREQEDMWSGRRSPSPRNKDE